MNWKTRVQKNGTNLLNSGDNTFWSCYQRYYTTYTSRIVTSIINNKLNSFVFGAYIRTCLEKKQMLPRVYFILIAYIKTIPIRGDFTTCKKLKVFFSSRVLKRPD